MQWMLRLWRYFNYNIGDPEAWNPKGNCKNHQGFQENKIEQQFSAEFNQRFIDVFKSAFYFLFQLCENAFRLESNFFQWTRIKIGINLYHLIFRGHFLNYETASILTKLRSRYVGMHHSNILMWLPSASSLPGSFRYGFRGFWLKMSMYHSGESF